MKLEDRKMIAEKLGYTVEQTLVRAAGEFLQNNPTVDITKLINYFAHTNEITLEQSATSFTENHSNLLNAAIKVIKTYSNEKENRQFEIFFDDNFGGNWDDGDLEVLAGDVFDQALEEIEFPK